ncbi:MAG: hypothetical protein ACXQTJ_01040 [Candidatus Syntropharchaeales archaeon]
MSEVTESELFAEFSESFESLWGILEAQAGRNFGSLNDTYKHIAIISVMLDHLSH